MPVLSPHPTSVVVERREPKRDRRYTEQSSVRYPIAMATRGSPEPVPYSQFYGVGRDPVHAWGHKWRYTALAIQSKLAIAAQRFGVEKQPSALVISQNVGRQNPIVGRPNIDSPGSMALGSRHELKPHTTYAPQYAKII